MTPRIQAALAATLVGCTCGQPSAAPVAVSVETDTPSVVSSDLVPQPAAAVTPSIDTDVPVMVQVGDGPPTPGIVLLGDQLAPGVYEPPFSTDALRAGMPKGTVFEYRITRPDHPVVLSTWEVVKHGPSEFTFRFSDRREDGSLYAPPREQSQYWVELRNRSAFPEAEYTKTETTVRVNGKSTAGWLYEGRGKPAAYVERSWFAKDSPGPPVVFSAQEGGREVMRMELIRRAP